MGAGVEMEQPPDPVGELTIDLGEAPPAVRRRLAEYAAAALPNLSETEIPPSIRPFVGFTAAKRATLGAGALVESLQARPAFRAAVVDWTRANRPARMAAGQSDPVSAAVVAILLGAPDAAELVAVIDRRDGDAQLRRERDEALARVERLESDLSKARSELAAAQAEAGRTTGPVDETERLRGRLRDQGVRLRRALDEAAALTGTHDAEVAGLRQALTAAHADLDRERARTAAAVRRTERLTAELENVRRTAREGRRADEMRLSLLLDTLSGAATGLRRELGLTGTASGPRPADLVGTGAGGPSGGAVTDITGLDRLLALPGVHLVVDGYNVTKTGYPEMTLSEQRERLVGQLAAVAARTGAEVTVAFDGAAVTARTSSSRGVRVLFSAPGVLADDLIRDLVNGEPAGRPLVVVTSDRAVVLSVRAAGAFTAPSSLLLARFDRT